MTDFSLKPCPFHLPDEYGPCAVFPGPAGSWEYWNTRKFGVACPCGARGPFAAIPDGGIYQGESHKKKNEEAREKAVELWNRRPV